MYIITQLIKHFISIFSSAPEPLETLPMVEPVEEVKPKEPVKQFSDKVVAWATAIQKHEGFFAPGEHPKYPNGSLSWRNNNPGNFRYVGQAGVTPSKGGVWCTFPTYEGGFHFLCKFLVDKATRESGSYSPEMTLYEFFAGTYDRNGRKLLPGYAPKEDHNDPLNYAEIVAEAIGVTIDTKIKDLII